MKVTRAKVFIPEMEEVGQTTRLLFQMSNDALDGI
jgi:hypothetical protein